MCEIPLDYVDTPHSEGAKSWSIARRLRPAQGQGINKSGLVWLGGFASDMSGLKAQFVDEWAKKNGQAFLRFDYSGHGASKGKFIDGSISDWLEQSLFLFHQSTQGPQILIGSSMGAWIALLMARRLALVENPRRLAGLILLAPAVDFTECLIWSQLDSASQRTIIDQGQWLRPSAYAPEPTPITRLLIEDGRRHLLLGNVIKTHAPVHIIHGLRDTDVPWRHVLNLLEHICADPVTLSCIPDGDHRLSRPEDLSQLGAALDQMNASVERTAIEE
ncbi:MAG: alpha/beta fold hydrolase [Methylocystaceae bacterium]|nr:alpha/beta fold hydrolase [Methylocystaceae bacterium]